MHITEFAEAYVVFDVETSGLGPEHDHILEIAWRKVINGIEGPVLSFLTDPGPALTAIDPKVTAVNGLTLERVRTQGVPLAYALQRLLTAAGDLPLVGHNVFRFDAPFLRATLDRASGPVKTGSAWARSVILYDTAAVYKAHKLGEIPVVGESHRDFALRVLDIRTKGLRYNLQEVCTQLGVGEGLTFHRAKGDVEATTRAFQALQALPQAVGELRPYRAKVVQTEVL